MNHISDDQVLAFVLGTLDEKERAQVAEHVTVCNDCAARVEEARREVNALGGVQTVIPVPEIPLPVNRGTVWREIVKAAAVLLVGFAIGWAVTSQRAPEVVTVVPYAVNASAPVDSGLVASEAVDLRI